MSSSTIESYSYDSRNEVLTIKFKTGSSYMYFDVPEEVYKGLETAESKGKFFYSEIRTSYRYEKL